MVNLTDPIVLSTLSTVVQTVVLSLTLIIFILTFRSQNKAIQEQAYQKVMDDYSDAMRVLSDKPELYNFQLELFSRSRRLSPKQYSREEIVVRNFVVQMYGFFERIHALYRRKWIDESTWKQWAAFLQIVASHPVFREVHETSMEMWDQPFVDYVDSVIKTQTKLQPTKDDPTNVIS